MTGPANKNPDAWLVRRSGPLLGIRHLIRLPVTRVGRNGHEPDEGHGENDDTDGRQLHDEEKGGRPMATSRP